MKVYATICGKKFDGYDIVLFNVPKKVRDRINDGTIFIDTNCYNKLSKGINTFLDDNFEIPSGSEIYVSPNCPVASNDIRKNYKIKRTPDSGVCNVFSSFTTNNYLWVANCAYCESTKTFFGTCANTAFFGTEIVEYFKALNKPVETADICPVGTSWSFFYGDKLEPYIQLINGEYKKPCVSYEKLKFENCNELTLDVLDLVYRAGSREIEYDKFLLQLKALNQCDWREYPRTITILLHEMMRNMHNKRHAAHYINSQPKPIKNILNTYSEKAKSEKDFDMAKAFITKTLGMDGVRFTDVKTLSQKLNEYQLSLDAFSEFFDNMVRLTGKEYEGEDDDTVQ